MVNYELIDHTADIGIKVKGNDLKALFVNAAQAMFDVIAKRPKSLKKLKKERIEVSLTATNIEELFVRWLSELLSLSDWKDIFFTEFHIAKLTETALKAAVAGLPQKHFEGKREVKAATYHNLKIVRQNNGYRAEVIFDV